MFYSLKNRLIASFVVLLVLSFGTVSFLLFNESRSIVRSYIESSALEKMDEYGSYINMALNQIYDLSSLVYNNDLTKNWDIALSDPSLSPGEKMLYNLDLSRFLTQTTNNYSGVSSVSIYRPEGLWVSIGNQVVADTTFLDEPWYKDFMQNGNHWVSAHRDQVESSQSKPYQVVSLLLPIGTFEPSLYKSVMKVNVSVDFFLEPLKRIHLGDSGTIFLLDQNGHPILSQNEYASDPETIRNVEAVRAVRARQGVLYLPNDRGMNDIVVYKKLNPWLLVGVVSEQDLYAKLYTLRNSIILFTTLLLLCAILVATWLSHGITKPLSRLASAMRSVQKGDFANAESRIPADQIVRNEVGYVTSTFRNMVAQLRHHIQTEFELKLLRQQAEYKALLLQINPHFLFNTLELMSSLSMQRRTNDTVKVIESLGKMMRFSLRISEDLVPLQEELTYLKHYVSILQIRFAERLHISIEEEGNMDSRQMVKFILQPLVENAVKYSFLHQTIAKVVIRIYSESEQVRLIVEDNGPGIAEELIQRLYAESLSSQFDHILNTGARQIGLRNVLARCQLYYGGRFSFTIESPQGQGTRIELILPVQQLIMK
ncbi:two-component system, sensor histidine kinase YesM [Paenibacillus sp. 1_12]|uniref:cache domain-containing sensor histidine kinase n=1 Tax=Paenibacillus sp. 1_12 TaxID=1566278 RepID=UPI0008F1F1F5|nr:sensor histidine kinase [Paenibacillus sp. 1_12]SFM02781.1 two-component system, sensor histidine kinase YesM [Paenibacillus sp. 1_12]